LKSAGRKLQRANFGETRCSPPFIVALHEGMGLRFQEAIE
jgi:hypothetical protein